MLRAGLGGQDGEALQNGAAHRILRNGRALVRLPGAHVDSEHVLERGGQGVGHQQGDRAGTTSPSPTSSHCAVWSSSLRLPMNACIITLSSWAKEALLVTVKIAAISVREIIQCGSLV